MDNGRQHITVQVYLKKFGQDTQINIISLKFKRLSLENLAEVLCSQNIPVSKVSTQCQINQLSLVNI